MLQRSYVHHNIYLCSTIVHEQGIYFRSSEDIQRLGRKVPFGPGSLFVLTDTPYCRTSGRTKNSGTQTKHLNAIRKRGTVDSKE